MHDIVTRLNCREKPVAASELVRLLEAIEELATAHGDRIPAMTLQPICPFPGVRFNDYPVSSLKGATKKLRQLISIS